MPWGRQQPQKPAAGMLEAEAQAAGPAVREVCRGCGDRMVRGLGGPGKPRPESPRAGVRLEALSRSSSYQGRAATLGVAGRMRTVAGRSAGEAWWPRVRMISANGQRTDLGLNELETTSGCGQLLFSVHGFLFRNPRSQELGSAHRIRTSLSFSGNPLRPAPSNRRFPRMPPSPLLEQGLAFQTRLPSPPLHKPSFSPLRLSMISSRELVQG